MKIQKPKDENNKLYQLELCDSGLYENKDSLIKYNILESDSVYMPDNAPDWIECDSIDSATYYFNVVQSEKRMDINNGNY